MPSPARRLAGLAGPLVLLLAAAAAGRQAAPPAADLGAATAIAPGVSLYHLTDPRYLEPPAPVSIWLLRVETRSVDVRAVLANDAIVDTETVPDMAVRYGALAAVNAGFFLLPSGDPAGIYKLKGQLVSDTRRQRGAVGIVRTARETRFVFGRVAATMALKVRRRARSDVPIEIAGVDTTRQRGNLMLFTPAYHAHTDTAAGGTEWVLEGNPLRVASAPLTAGRTPIPRQGFVLSYGGTDVPPALKLLRPGARVDLETIYQPLDGRAEDWAQAEDIIGGAGLLRRNGEVVSDWAIEKFSPGFAATRHPRTLIGTHRDGSVWLITVDGRQPHLSAGMTLPEVSDLVGRLGLHDALNLDGGGSTTMWVGGRIVNSPSDLAGARKVSDALLVTGRGSKP